MKKGLIRRFFIGMLLAFTALSGNAFAGQVKKSDGSNAGVQWFSSQQVAALLAPGAVWCFEPEEETCLFKAISNGEIAGETNSWFSYDVLELWDDTTVLSVPTLGELSEDGFLCETIDIAFEGISIIRLDGTPVSKTRFAEIKAELVEAWRPDEGRQFCFRYIRETPGGPEIISQYMFARDNPDGAPLRFVLSSDVPAVTGFELRY